MSLMLVVNDRIHAEEEPSTIRSDERVVFFPTAASVSKDGRKWTIPVHGWIFEPEGDSTVRNQLMRQLRNEFEVVIEDESVQRFDARLRLFLRDNERGKEVGIRLCGRTFVLNESEADGHFTGELELPDDLVQQHARNGWLSFQAVVPEGDKRVFAGRVQLVPRRGVTVVSDIDDTVKISLVTHKPELIANTLVRPFRAAPGMDDLYRNWEKQGATFCFVSSSPWQLYEPLSDWMNRDRFPEAAFALGRTDIQMMSVMSAASQMKPAKFCDFFSYLVAIRRQRLRRPKNLSIWLRC